MTQLDISLSFSAAGILWLLVGALVVVGLSAIGGGSIPSMFLYYWWVFAGPLLLIAAAVLTSRGERTIAPFLALPACVLLVSLFTYLVVGILQDLRDPLFAMPGIPVIAALVAIAAATGLATYATVQLLRARGRTN